VTAAEPKGFSYRERKSGDVEVLHHGKKTALLRSKDATVFRVASLLVVSLIASAAAGCAAPLNPRTNGLIKTGMNSCASISGEFWNSGASAASRVGFQILWIVPNKDASHLEIFHGTRSGRINPSFPVRLFWRDSELFVRASPDAAVNPSTSVLLSQASGWYCVIRLGAPVLVRENFTRGTDGSISSSQEVEFIYADDKKLVYENYREAVNGSFPFGLFQSRRSTVQWHYEFARRAVT
jgi:hypothetical protein